MARRCSITGKGPLAGNHVSHANNKVRRRQLPNLQTKRIFVPELDKFVKIKLSTRALRTIDKKGLIPFLKSEGLSLKDVII
ncbi:50S ribosomal protein L28 [Candidatus Mycalebacterium sp.]